MKGLNHMQIGAKLSMLGNGAAISYWNGSFDINLLEPGLTNSSRCILSSGNTIDRALFERAKVRLAELTSPNLLTYLTALHWRDRHDRVFAIGDMTTLYLYHTVKMIWNNVVSPRHPYGDVIRWEFDSVNYPKTYLRAFYKVGLAALKLRRNRKVAGGFLDHVEAWS